MGRALGGFGIHTQRYGIVKPSPRELPAAGRILDHARRRLRRWRERNAVPTPQLQGPPLQGPTPGPPTPGIDGLAIGCGGRVGRVGRAGVVREVGSVPERRREDDRSRRRSARCAKERPPGPPWREPPRKNVAADAVAAAALAAGSGPSAHQKSERVDRRDRRARPPRSPGLSPLSGSCSSSFAPHSTTDDGRSVRPVDRRVNAQRATVRAFHIPSRDARSGSPRRLSVADQDERGPEEGGVPGVLLSGAELEGRSGAALPRGRATRPLLARLTGGEGHRGA